MCFDLPFRPSHSLLIFALHPASLGMAIFITPEGGVTLQALLLLTGVPLVGIGQYHSSADFVATLMGGSSATRPIQSTIGLVCISAGLLLALIAVLVNSDDEGYSERRLSLKYDMMPPKDVLEEIRNNHRIVQTGKKSGGVKPTAAKENKVKIMRAAICSLSSLAIRLSKEQKQRKLKEAAKTQSSDDPLNIAAAEASWADRFLHKPHELELVCQEGAYLVINMYPSEDATVASALSLLALVAGDSMVRKRNIEEADRFGLNEPIAAMRNALKRSKECLNPTELDERFSAELQRKGCLLMGAMSDKDKDIATKIVDEDGLVAVLDALDWFRCHEDIANWGLWAIFSLCYEHRGNKAELVKLDGIRRICGVMKDIPECEEVARHGIAIVFDLLRELPETLVDVSKIRQVAIGSGFQKRVKEAMVQFPQSKEIVMMGQQMLVATGYKGEIPHFSMAQFVR